MVHLNITGTNWDNHEKFGFCVDITPDGKHVIAGTPNANIFALELSDPKGQGVIRYYKLVSDADGGGYNEISGKYQIYIWARVTFLVVVTLQVFNFHSVTLYQMMEN